MFGLQKCQERVFLKAQRVKKPFNLPECRRNDLLPSWPQEAMQPWHAGDVFRSKQKRCHGRTLANSQVPVKGAQVEWNVFWAFWAFKTLFLSISRVQTCVFHLRTLGKCLFRALSGGFEAFPRQVSKGGKAAKHKTLVTPPLVAKPGENRRLKAMFFGSHSAMKPGPAGAKSLLPHSGRLCNVKWVFGSLCFLNILSWHFWNPNMRFHLQTL